MKAIEPAAVAASSLEDSIGLPLPRQLIDGYSSRNGKGHLASFQANKYVVLDDVLLARAGNHTPKRVSNYRRCRKWSRKGQEKKTRYMCAECDVPLCITTCFSSFHMANNHH
ncbi:piggyBac transposable element-derived protein 4 [Trichonephila clavipes]|nr:piggyBac transposable element-derived protein 4 [Trichonephila clavipes]